MLNPHTKAVTADCLRCDGTGDADAFADSSTCDRPSLRPRKSCPSCDGFGSVCVQIANGLGHDAEQDAIVDAQWNRDIAKGLRAPDCSQETADYMNAQVRR